LTYYSLRFEKSKSAADATTARFSFFDAIREIIIQQL